jgi:hypothetical protein
MMPACQSASRGRNGEASNAAHPVIAIIPARENKASRLIARSNLDIVKMTGRHNPVIVKIAIADLPPYMCDDPVTGFERRKSGLRE